MEKRKHVIPESPLKIWMADYVEDKNDEYNFFKGRSKYRKAKGVRYLKGIFMPFIYLNASPTEFVKSGIRMVIYQ